MNQTWPKNREATVSRKNTKEKKIRLAIQQPNKN